MGVDHYIYVIPASKYMELIRPLLIKFYGILDFKSVFRE